MAKMPSGRPQEHGLHELRLEAAALESKVVQVWLRSRTKDDANELAKRT